MERKPSSLSPQIFSLKKFLIFFLKKPSWKKFIFSQKKFFLYLGKQNFPILSLKKIFLYFGKWNFLVASLKRNLIFPEWTCKAWKINKKIRSEEISYIFREEVFLAFWDDCWSTLKNPSILLNLIRKALA